MLASTKRRRPFKINQTVKPIFIITHNIHTTVTATLPIHEISRFSRPPYVPSTATHHKKAAHTNDATMLLPSSSFRTHGAATYTETWPSPPCPSFLTFLPYLNQPLKNPFRHAAPSEVWLVSSTPASSLTLNKFRLPQLYRFPRMSNILTSTERSWASFSTTSTRRLYGYGTLHDAALADLSRHAGEIDGSTEMLRDSVEVGRVHARKDLP